MAYLLLLLNIVTQLPNAVKTYLSLMLAFRKSKSTELSMCCMSFIYSCNVHIISKNYANVK